ncbi:MAG: hypothetical protein AAB669_01490 [Patescibacteria group bacterium]
MFQIVLNGQKIRATEFKYPCLIHGKQGSGASQFTIFLASDLLRLGREVIFFSAFPAGKANLLDQLGDASTKVMLPESGNEEAFIEALNKASGDSLAVVKNIEEYSRQLMQKVVGYENIVLSGDFDLFKHTDILPEAQIRIMFSAVNLPGFPRQLPALDKYEGFLASNASSGRVSLAVGEGE